jgi:hypothetical protein
MIVQSRMPLNTWLSSGTFSEFLSPLKKATFAKKFGLPIAGQRSQPRKYLIEAGHQKGPDSRDTNVTSLFITKVASTAVGTHPAAGAESLTEE